MRHHFYAAAAFTLLSSFTSFLSVANSQDLDVSDSPYGLFADSALDSSTDVDFIDPNSSSSYLITSTSDDPLFGDLPADSNNLLGQDDLLDQDLMLSSNDQCSFDAASIDADGFLDPIVKRESGPACKIRQQGSTSNKVPQPPEDPQDFLNNLPFFEGHEDPVLHERTEICKPQFTANRGIPMCLIGVSELALQSGQYFPEGLLVGCAPLDPLLTTCPDGSELMCCRQADIDPKINLHFDLPGLMAQSDHNLNLDRCNAQDCVETSGVGIPWDFHLPLPAFPSHSPRRF